MIKTELCDLLDITYPILQGGMAWVADASLAAAVSNGGGLGIIGAMNANSEWLEEQVAKLRSLTSKSFGVNVMLLSPFADEVARAVVHLGVPVVTTGAGTPLKYMKDWLDAGIKVLPVVPSVAVAKLVAKRGATAVIAEGGESGGHVGDLTTMVLTPQICDAVSIPVLAAGGIADGRGMAAALMLGAVGVQMGTRFLVADECQVHPNYKKRVIQAQDIDTITTGRRLGHPVRSLKSPFSIEYANLEYDSTISNEDLEAKALGALRIAVIEGDEKRGCFMAGQCAALVHKAQPASEIIREVCEEAEILLKRACQWIN
jgi:enoyl-[acyl-carrier protein] reductase II